MTIQAEVEYLRYQAERPKQPEYQASTAGRSAQHEIDQPVETVNINVDDGRHLQKNNDPREFGMHESGFDLFKHRSSVDNFFDKEQLSTVYDNEIEALLKSITGCYRVHIFDHTVRASDPAVREQKNLREPSYMVHNDYTAKSGFVCLQENLGDEADALATIYRFCGYDGMGLPESYAELDVEAAATLAERVPVADLVIRDLAKARLLPPVISVQV